MGSAAALAIGGLTGGLTAINSFAASRLQAAQQKAQGQALQAQANVTRQQAAITAEKGRIEAENFDRQKSALRREYEDIQGRNRSLLAAGNVDMGSGSALDTGMGNIERFASDVGENAYQKALKEWETAQAVKNLAYQADMYDAQGSYLKKSAGNVGTSLLTAGLSGLSTGLGMYNMAGGKLPSLFGSKAGSTPFGTTRRLLTSRPANPANAPGWLKEWAGGR